MERLALLFHYLETETKITSLHFIKYLLSKYINIVFARRHLNSSLMKKILLSVFYFLVLLLCSLKEGRG